MQPTRTGYFSVTLHHETDAIDVDTQHRAGLPDARRIVEAVALAVVAGYTNAAGCD
jgi:hypothetical protein